MRRLLFALTIFLVGAPVAAGPLVLGAASLADALEEAGRVFAEEGGAEVSFSFAGSNTLARQLEAGGPGEMIVSAHRAPIDRLVAAGRVAPGSAAELVGNRLVVVVPRTSDTEALTSPRQLERFERLAVADPEGVPAGLYARAWLERAGLWQRLRPRLVPSLDVRAALATVAGGHVPAAIVYATDAASTEKVQVVLEVADEASPAVRYWSAPVVGAGTEARAFLKFLHGPRGAKVFRRHGFEGLAKPK